MYVYLGKRGSSAKAAWQLENAIVGKFLQQYPEAMGNGSAGVREWDLAFKDFKDLP